jgi:hypothetical protein
VPIRPEFRKYYLADWQAYRLTLIELAGNRCTKCRALLDSSELTGAHMTHDPRDMALVSVLCFPCHARHDAPHRLAMMRRSRAKRTGQLWLLPELEYAPFPAWAIPRRVLDAAQERMFG